MGATQVPASSISFANTFGVLFTVVAYDLALVPLLNRLKRPISMTCRIGLGFVIQVRPAVGDLKQLLATCDQTQCSG